MKTINFAWNRLEHSFYFIYRRDQMTTFID